MGVSNGLSFKTKTFQGEISKYLWIVLLPRPKQFIRYGIERLSHFFSITLSFKTKTFQGEISKYLWIVLLPRPKQFIRYGIERLSHFFSITLTLC